VSRRSAAPALEETRRQWLTRIETQRKEPDGVITNALQRHGNPYTARAPALREHVRRSRAGRETPSASSACASFHARFYNAAVSEFAAVGDHDAAA
jgi:zinc protease